MKLNIATCQFPVGDDPRANARYVMRQMKKAKEQGAHVAHFCEGALSGYAGNSLSSFENYDWGRLTQETEHVMALARRLRLWVVIGSSHPLTGSRKPHNSVYIIDDRGELIDRYDKRFCAGNPEETEGDLAHYTPGDHACVFTIRGIRCGVLICYDYRYPELYRDYKRRGVELLFHSYHAAKIDPETYAMMQEQVGRENHALNHGSTYPEITMPATMQAAAASSHLWISCANSSARQSCWPAFFVRADGVVTGRLRRNVPGILLSSVDPKKELYDSTRDWRARAMKGVLHSGRLVKDRRSKNREAL
jgi:predicted amidohydrolase